MTSAQPTETRPPTWHEELTHDLADATEKTRAAWLSQRNVVATYLRAVCPTWRRRSTEAGSATCATGGCSRPR